MDTQEPCEKCGQQAPLTREKHLPSWEEVSPWFEPGVVTFSLVCEVCADELEEEGRLL